MRLRRRLPSGEVLRGPSSVDARMVAWSPARLRTCAGMPVVTGSVAGGIGASTASSTAAAARTPPVTSGTRASVARANAWPGGQAT